MAERRKEPKQIHAYINSLSDLNYTPERTLLLSLLLWSLIRLWPTLPAREPYLFPNTWQLCDTTDYDRHIHPNRSL